MKIKDGRGNGMGPSRGKRAILAQCLRISRSIGCVMMTTDVLQASCHCKRQPPCPPFDRDEQGVEEASQCVRSFPQFCFYAQGD
jgi:hypothetical protein